VLDERPNVQKSAGIQDANRASVSVSVGKTAHGSVTAYDPMIIVKKSTRVRAPLRGGIANPAAVEDNIGRAQEPRKSSRPLESAPQ
jgi:hypothetical protein